MNYDAIIIGAGACGLMCAAQAGHRGKKTLVLERNPKAGAKILISGGGRCNFTNTHSSPSNFITEDPSFLKSILARWSVDDTLSFFGNHGVLAREKTLGQLFPVSNKSKDIVDVLLQQMQLSGQEMKLNSEVRAIEQSADGFLVSFFCDGVMHHLHSDKVVVASGGLPIAKLGASDFGLRLARQYAMPLIDTAPALVPLTITGKDAEWFAALAGNSVFAKVGNERISFKENLLFTHWGLSGPAILQISSYWNPGEWLSIDLLPDHSMEQIIRQERSIGGKRLLLQVLQDYFTKRFADALGKFLPLQTKIASLSKKDALLVFETIHQFKVKPAGTKGYEKAEVMRGGVATSALKDNSLEAKQVPGLYFGGECVDVTGWLGGYNFQWAWASAFVIAQDI